MSDLINRADAIEVLKSNYDLLERATLRTDRARRDEISAMMAKIMSLPSADVVEIVRCKECKHTIIRPDGEIYCKKLDMEETPVSHFCGWGKRKDGEA